MFPKNHRNYAVAVLALGISLAPTARAATVFVGVHFGPSPDNVIVAAGDTVVWQNTNTTHSQVWSYTGAWPTAILATNGARFTNVFSEPGYYPYRVTAESGPSGMFQDGGAVTVVTLSNAPPVLLNAPVAGHYPMGYGIAFEASPRDPNDVQRIDFLVGANIVGTATNFPYAVRFTS